MGRKVSRGAGKYQDDKVDNFQVSLLFQQGVKHNRASAPRRTLRNADQLCSTTCLPYNTQVKMATLIFLNLLIRLVSLVHFQQGC